MRLHYRREYGCRCRLPCKQTLNCASVNHGKFEYTIANKPKLPFATGRKVFPIEKDKLGRSKLCHADSPHRRMRGSATPMRADRTPDRTRVSPVHGSFECSGKPDIGQPTHPGRRRHQFQRSKMSKASTSIRGCTTTVRGQYPRSRVVDQRLENCFYQTQTVSLLGFQVPIGWRPFQNFFQRNA